MSHAPLIWWGGRRSSQVVIPFPLSAPLLIPSLLVSLTIQELTSVYIELAVYFI